MHWNTKQTAAEACLSRAICIISPTNVNLGNHHEENFIWMLTHFMCYGYNLVVEYLPDMFEVLSVDLNNMNDGGSGDSDNDGNSDVIMTTVLYSLLSRKQQAKKKILED